MSSIDLEHEESLDSIIEVDTPIKEETEVKDKKEETLSSNARMTQVTGTTTTSNDFAGKLPSIELKTFMEAIIKLAKRTQEPTDEMTLWKEHQEEATENYTTGGLYQKRFTENGSNFEQGLVDSEGLVTSLAAPIKFKNTSGEMKGEIALLKVSKLLGIGEVVNVGLPHSGIWVTVKPPTDKDIIDFYNTVFREKVMLGRSTSGLTFSNFSVYLNNKLFQFIIKHVHSVNYSDIPKDELENFISSYDLPILAWGFACAMYPNGFPYERACIPTEDKQCTHISKELINLDKLIWLDNSALSQAQKNIFSENRPNKLTLDSYNKYQAEHVRVVGDLVTVKEGIRLKLKIPTFTEYTTDGLNWINGISNAVETVLLSTEDNEQGKLELINQYVKTSVLRQFNHFVDFIEIEDSVVTDRKTINNLLEMFSGDDELRTSVVEAIIKFKEKTTIAIVGIQEYECPVCKSKQEGSDLPRFVNVIPLDSMNLFFLMLTSKISKILERDV